MGISISVSNLQKVYLQSTDPCICGNTWLMRQFYSCWRVQYLIRKFFIRLVRIFDKIFEHRLILRVVHKWMYWVFAKLKKKFIIVWKNSAVYKKTWILFLIVFHNFCGPILLKKLHFDSNRPYFWILYFFPK